MYLICGGFNFEGGLGIPLVRDEGRAEEGTIGWTAGRKAGTQVVAFGQLSTFWGTDGSDVVFKLFICGKYLNLSGEKNEHIKHGVLRAGGGC